MKKQLLIAPILLLGAFGAQAKSYVTVGYGVASPTHSHSANFTDASNAIVQQVTPNTSDTIWGLTVGFSTANNAAVELSYSNFRSDIEHETLGTPPAGSTFPTTHSFDANFIAHQIAITPVYFTTINQNIRAKAGVGLSYTEYEINGHNEQELGEINLGPIPGVRNPNIQTNKEFGLIGILGADYSVLDGVSLGVQGSYSYDKYAQNAALLGTLTVHF